MFQHYNGIVDVAFNRKTGELVFALKNTDGLSSGEITNMIEDIVARSTGKNVGNATVLGQSCNDLNGMKAVLEEKDEIRRENRFNALATKLEENLDQVLSESLVTPIPQKAGEKGYAPFVGIAAKVTEVSAASDPNLYERFTENLATPVLQKAISELTNGKIKDFTDGNIQQTTAAIMGNVISNYENLTTNQKKLALVNAALGGNVPEQLVAYRKAIATAAAIEASRLGVTEKQIEKVRQISARLDQNREGESSDIGSFGKEVLNALNLKGPSGKLDVDDLRVSKSILNSTFPQNFSVSPEAWQVAAQKELVGGRA